MFQLGYNNPLFANQEEYDEFIKRHENTCNIKIIIIMVSLNPKPNTDGIFAKIERQSGRNKRSAFLIAINNPINIIIKANIKSKGISGILCVLLVEDEVVDYNHYFDDDYELVNRCRGYNY